MALDRDPPPHDDTIAAVATPPGQGGIGVVRISGPAARAVARALIGTLPEPRVATLADFREADGTLLDTGLALHFPAPHSYTGEDVLELHGHGGPIVLDLLLRSCVAAGARHARPGEFTERAFLNGKMDLAQAEAVADLISARSAEAARGATRSLHGALSARVEALASGLTELRAWVEASIDFAEDDVELLAEGDVAARVAALQSACAQTLAESQQGALVNEGVRTAIAGVPNVGKSSLLNRLSGTDAALVTPVPGTTRDVIRQEIRIDGLPLLLMDTAGLRDSDDLVERLGHERARAAIADADLLIIVVDARSPQHLPRVDAGPVPVVTVRNKIDLSGDAPGRVADSPTCINVSARTGAGIDVLRLALRAAAGATPTPALFTARRRHVDALEAARDALARAAAHVTPAPAIELVAEELRIAHEAVQTITGRFTTEELLGEIFASFCIGK